MKKILSLAAAVTAVSLSFVNAKIASVSYTDVFSKCKKGKEITEKITKKNTDFQAEVMQFQKEFTEKRDELQKQEKVLTKEAMEEKRKKLDEELRSAQMKLAQKERDTNTQLKQESQEYQEAQRKLIEEFCKKESIDLMVAKEGTLYVSNDETDRVIKFLDVKYEEEVKTTKLAKNGKTEKATTKAKKTTKVA